MFNINTDRLIEMLLSPRLLASAFISVLKSILEPIKSLLTQLNAYRTVTTTKLSYNGQVCHLERLLNNGFDPINREIYITDAISISMLVIYPADNVDNRVIVAPASGFENYPVIAYQRAVVGDKLHNFIVNIPDSNEVRARENELKATVSRYKFSGKGFFLRYY